MKYIFVTEFNHEDGESIRRLIRKESIQTVYDAGAYRVIRFSIGGRMGCETVQVNESFNDLEKVLNNE